MRNPLLLSFLTVVFSIGLSHITYAVCVQTGTIPGQGNIINCPAPIQNTPLNLGSVPNTTMLDDEVNVPAGGGIINLGAGDAIFTSGGKDIVTSSGDLSATTGVGIATSNDDDMVTVDGGSISSDFNVGIFTSGGSDTVTINDGLVKGGNDAIFTGSGNDDVTVNGGTLMGGITFATIFTGSENDVVTLNGGIYMHGADRAIFLGSGNDLLTFGANIDLDGFVDCGSDFDTLVFAMEVPEEAVNIISSQILAQNPQNGSVVINDIEYSWENCELLVPELVGVRVLRPIPTLSQWGLIAMAGILGIISIFAIRNRVTA